MNDKATIELVSGRKIKMVTLAQSMTYLGLLEGRPTKEMNQKNIERALKTATEGSRFPVYLIEPEQKLTKWTREKPYPFGTPATLPGITCIARFQSIWPCQGQEGDGSDLLIVWYQDEYALPIALDVLEHIRTLDWDNKALSWEW